MANEEKKYEPIKGVMDEEFNKQIATEIGFPPTDDEEEEVFETNNVEEDYQDNSLLMHCKPVFNFQSIEFDIVVNPNDPESMEYMKGVYSQVLNCLMAVAVNQPNQPGAKKEPELEDQPTKKMKDIMDKFGINYDKYTTKKQAQALIEKSLKG